MWDLHVRLRSGCGGLEFSRPGDWPWGQLGKIFGAGNMRLCLSNHVSKFGGDNMYRHKRINSVFIYCEVS